MTSVDNVTDNKKADDHGFDDMKTGSYLKERLVHSGSSSGETTQADDVEGDKENGGHKKVGDKESDTKESSKEASKASAEEAILEPTISTLILSLSSAALMALGLATDPSQKDKAPKVDKPMAKFNIDMLIMLKEKTEGNLDSHEQKLLDAIISDLQIRYIEVH